MIVYDIVGCLLLTSVVLMTNSNFNDSNLVLEPFPITPFPMVHLSDVLLHMVMFFCPANETELAR